MALHKNCRIAYGCTRRVFLIGNFAIKIPNFFDEWRLGLLGLLSNMQEAQFSKTGWPELCPVRFSIPGGFLVVMDRARELTEDEFLELDLKTWVDRGEYMIPAEIKTNSFGYLNGKLVAIDYGN